MALGGPPVPNSADRRAWLRSYHYYRSKMMEEPAGAEALAMCADLIAADDSWAPPQNVVEASAEMEAPPTAPGDGDGLVRARKPKPGEEKAKNLAPSALAGSPAAIHHSLPFFKEGRVFADPWRLPEKAKTILQYFAEQALDSEDADLLIPEPDLWRKWVPSIGEQGYGIGSLRALDILRGLRMAGILSELERLDQPPVIWQAGPSITSARALKMKLPRAKFVLSAEPWEMVSPIAFLREMMPDCPVTVMAEPEGVAEALEHHDFVFVPSSAIASLALPRLDLFLDAMSLQLVDEAVVTAHARKAHQLAATWYFALTLDGDSPEWRIARAVPAFEQYFWVHQMPVRPVVDWQMATLIDEGFVARGYVGRPEDIKYWKLNTHFSMGWRRMKI